ncbi:uncharacterized protein LOC100370085 [Saccoglossus kowalevskii]
MAEEEDSDIWCLVDTEFVKSVQGFSRTGYVPTNNEGLSLSRSGVNVGYGVDIGNLDAEYFRELDVSEETITLFEPYFGLKGADAQSKVTEVPLELTEEEAMSIGDKHIEQQITELSDVYDTALESIEGDLDEFEDLTVSQRTVIFDVFYQYGSNPARFPTYWRYVTNQQWANALSELRNFGDIYPERRIKEADLLEFDTGLISACSDATPWDCLINKDFIRQQQGFSSTGIVPIDGDGAPLEQSGVNVGYGINIGAKDASYFQALGLSEDIIEQLEPYFGLTGTDALEKLNETPLEIDDEEAVDVSDRVLNQHIQEVSLLYDTRVSELGGDLLEFEDLSIAQKTVIVDVYYQYGGPPQNRFPTYWGYVTNQEWSSALEELRNFRDSYPERRNNEGDLLEYDSGKVSRCVEPSVWDCLIYKDFIQKREGFVKDGYVPMLSDGTVMGQSGVQFGYGINLGGLDEEYFRNLGVSEELITLFRPYFGLKRDEAVQKLEEIPLILSEEDSKMISDLVMNQHIEEVAGLYDARVAELGDAELKVFANLTVAQKTVVADVFYQYGGPPTTRFPRFWGFVTSQQWDEAIGELRDFGDAYATRRNNEADLLEGDTMEVSLCQDDDDEDDDNDEIGVWDCDVDKAFIRGLDDFNTNGNVPVDNEGSPLTDKGVMIGAAIDLGNKDSDYFRESGISEEITMQLLPYLGLRGVLAYNKSLDQPLDLTESDAIELSDRIMDRRIDEMVREYNSRIEQLGGSRKEFSELTVAQKTVIASVYYQYGGPPVFRYPKYWGFVTTQDWDGALAELKDFRDRYPTRRNKEADYLEDDSGDTTLCPEPTRKAVSVGRCQAETSHTLIILIFVTVLIIRLL